MWINDRDVADFGARQWNVTPGFVTVKNNSEWAVKSPTPYLAGSYLQMAPLKVALLVKGSGRDEILMRCSDLIALLLEPVTIILDGMPTRQFVGVVAKWSLTESSRKRFHLLTIEVSGYWEGMTELALSKSLESGGEISVNNPGNIATPVRAEITAGGSASTLTIEGLGQDVTVSDVAANDAIVLDGATGLFTIGGSVDDAITAWELPVLQPGINTIKITGAATDVKLTFRPRYM